METKHTVSTMPAIFNILCFTTLFLLISSSSNIVQIKACRIQVRNFTRIGLSGPIGPETIAFDHAGEGPYTGVSDGRVLKWQGNDRGWIEFATTSPERKKEECDGTDDPKFEEMCGRPLGLRFNKATGDLYIADAYFGLLKVGKSGGPAAQIANSAEGQLLCFTNSLDIDETTGSIYFTESSTKYKRRDYEWAILTRDKTGRLMEYDPKSKQVRVLLRGLFFANGVALSKDKTFLLIAETTTCRILRFWLKGPKMGKYEVFVYLPGYPDNINRNAGGEFWVALNHGGKVLQKLSFLDQLEGNHVLASMRKFNVSDPLLEDYDIAGVKLSEEGKIVDVLFVDDGAIAGFVSELEEENGSLWLGSVVLPFAGVSKL